MYFDLYGIYQAISGYDNIYIYGMGTYSEVIVPKLLYDMGLKAKTAGYVLSDDQPQNQSSKDGIPIYKLSNLHIDASTSIFLIAARSNYARGIEKNLKNCNYINYIFLSHFEKTNDNNMYFKFANTNFDQYCKYISDWYECKYSKKIGGDYLEGRQKIYNEVKELFKKQSENSDDRNNKQIVFVVVSMMPRINKIIGALVDRGYEIVVLDMDKFTYPYSRYAQNIRVVYCECIEEVLFEAAKLNPLLFYVRPAWLDTSVASIMLMQRDSYGKIVVDIHDIAKGCYNLSPEQQWLFDIEKEALESADGVVWRYDAENFLKEKYGYQYRGRSIQFWDYCYDEFVFNESESDIGLKLCCIDSNAECLNPPDYDDLSKEGIARYANIYDILDKIGNRDDCEFNLYVSLVSEMNLKELQRLQEEYTNFNFFVGYTPQELIQSISKCDYGCCFYHSGRMRTDAECIEKGYFYLPGAYEVSATNKHFDYLNAGIPIVTSSYDGRKQIDYLKKYDVIVNMDLESLDIEYLMENKYLFRENVKAAKKHLAIGAQIDRLINFFNAI